ncbi:MAG TPA: hypothetical protein PK582_01360, partial [Prolixibacteraceae bacterium]|nr:hypothetical protein [Prolixibacteraceae bacterium]
MQQKHHPAHVLHLFKFVPDKPAMQFSSRQEEYPFRPVCFDHKCISCFVRFFGPQNHNYLIY